MNQNLQSVKKAPVATKPWWSDGLRFQCQGSGKCCTSHGEYGFVYLTLEDRKKMAKSLGLTTAVFNKKHCERVSGVWRLKEDPKKPDCQFLKGKSCGIYEARPIQCRTWPFWPEVMDAKTWAKDVVTFCPGVGKGPLISKEVIEKNLAEQISAEKRIVHGK